jgi:hypothetical protein
VSARKPHAPALFNGEGRVLLALHAGRQPDAGDEGWLYGMVGMGWIETSRRGVAITDAGGDALASWLLRTFACPVVVVEEQRAMRTDYAARFLIRIMTGCEPPPSVTWLSWLLQVGWIEIAHGAAFVTDSGRDALAAYLLRGWRP